MHASAVVPSTSPTLQAKERQARKMAARREQAFQELYDRHWKDVRNYVVWFLDGCRDVEDVVQEVFLRVYERLDDYDPTRPARPWLFRISSNVALNLVEEQMAQKRSVEDGQTVSLSRVSSEGDFIVDVPVFCLSRNRSFCVLELAQTSEGGNCDGEEAEELYRRGEGGHSAEALAGEGRRLRPLR